MRRVLSLFVAAVMMLTCFTVASASGVSMEPNDYAVYLEDDFEATGGMRVEGDIYIADGDAEFSNSPDNIVTGDIVLSRGNEVDIKGNGTGPSLTGEVIYERNLDFDVERPDIPKFPTIKNTIKSFSDSWSGATEPIRENTRFGDLTINKSLIFDTSAGDLYIIADTFMLNGDIQIVGSGNLYIMVNKSLKVNANTNTQGTADQLTIVVKGKVQAGGGTSLRANLYFDSDNVSLTGGISITGNVTTTAEDFKLNGGAVINGVVYAPDAEVSMGGGSVINGRLVADSLSMSGGSEIRYTNTPTDPEKTFYQLEIEIYPEGAGTVEPQEGVFEENAQVNLDVTANAGYEFTGFERRDEISSLPDENGQLTMVSDTYLIARFAKKDVVDDNIPDGPEVTLEFPYAYLYGYDIGVIVGVQDTIKREEASAIFYRILKNNNQIGSYTKPAVPTFSDIQPGRWSYAALEYMNTINVFDNFAPGSAIRPEASISRGEAAKIMACSLRIRPSGDSQIVFSDLSETNEYYPYIMAMVERGVMSGDGNGQIRPDDNITRAEFVKMVNYVIGRGDQYDITGLEVPYQDLQGYDANSWEFVNIMRASYGFSYDEESGMYKMDPARKPPRSEIDYD